VLGWFGWCLLLLVVVLVVVIVSGGRGVSGGDQ
jgi:hypothetical protein